MNGVWTSIITYRVKICVSVLRNASYGTFSGPDGLRHSKEVDGSRTVHVWDSSNIIYDRHMDSAGKAAGGARYIRDAGLVARQKKGGGDGGEGEHKKNRPQCVRNLPPGRSFVMGIGLGVTEDTANSWITRASTGERGGAQSPSSSNYVKRPYYGH